MESKIGTKPLDSSVVQIITDKGDVIGAGFLVSEKHIVTCVHVVARSLNLPDTHEVMPQDVIHLNFPLITPNKTLTARVVHWDPKTDIAVLSVDDEKSVPAYAHPIHLVTAEGASSDLWDHAFRAIGFPDGYDKYGVWASGVLRDMMASDWVQIEATKQTGYFVTLGFSGGPVWDEILQGAVGMVVAADAKRNIAGIIPTATLCKSWLPLEDSVHVIDDIRAYRRRLLDDTRLLNINSISPHVARSGQAIVPEIPLDKVYIRIQAVAQKEHLLQEKVETNQVLAMIEAQMKLHSRRTSPSDLLTTLRTLGEYLYRRGEIYHTTERPSPVDPQDALLEHKRLVILGAPGAGKSTMLRYIARCAARDANGPVPILVSLRDYATRLSQDSAVSLREFAIERVAGRNERLHGLLVDAIEKEQVLWLLDALDEARGWAEQVAEEAGRLPGQLILTSRPIGYVGAGQIHALPHFEVLPLEIDNVNQFLHKWFDVLAENRKATPGWAEKRVAELQRQLDDRPRLQPLMRNPLLLTFLALLGGEDPMPELPYQRAELYRQYVEKLFDSWESKRQKPDSDDKSADFELGDLKKDSASEAARKGLYYIGWYLHLTYYGSQREQIPDRSTLVSVLKEYYSKGPWSQHVDPLYLASEVLDFWKNAGLLDVWELKGQQFMTFRHLTFQEYAVAWNMAEEWECDPKGAWRFLKPRLHHYAWLEPILLLAGVWEERLKTPMTHGDTHEHENDKTFSYQTQRLNELITHLLKGPSPYEHTLYRDLRLAAALLGEVKSPDSLLTKKVIKRLNGVIDTIGVDKNPKKTRFRDFYGKCLLIFLLVTAIYVSVKIWPVGLLAKLFLIIGMGVLILVSYIVIFTFTSLSVPLINRFYWFTQVFLNKVIPKADPYIEALGKIGKPAIPDLVNIVIMGFGSKDDDARPAAAEALEKTGKADIVLPRVIKELGFTSTRDLSYSSHMSPLLGGMSVSHKHTYLNLFAGYSLPLIAKFGEAAVDPIIAAHNRYGHGAYFNIALAMIDDPNATGKLCSLLKNSDSVIRESAAIALGRIGDPETAFHLFETLSDSNSECRAAAANALGKIGKIHAVIHIKRALCDTGPLVREAAAYALGEIGKRIIEEDNNHRDNNEHIGTIIDALVEALNDTEVTVCVAAAAHALGRIGDPRAVVPLIKALQNVKQLSDQLQSFEKLSKDVLEGKQEELNQVAKQNRTTLPVGRVAAEALGEIGKIIIKKDNNHRNNNPMEHICTIIDALVEALNDTFIQTFESTPVDLETAANENPFMRGILERYFPSSPVMDNFPGRINLPRRVHYSVAEALGKIGDTKAVDALISALDNENLEVREAVLDALGNIDGSLDQRAIPPLYKASEGQQSNIKLCKALRRVGKPAITNLAESLCNTNTSPRYRMGAAQMLGIIGDLQAIGPLTQALSDSNRGVRNSAARALAKIDTTEAIDKLIENIGCKKSFLHMYAVETIGQHLDRIPNEKTARSIARTLWWRRTVVRVGDLKNIDLEAWTVPETSQWDALELVADRMSVLVVEELQEKKKSNSEIGENI